MPLIRFEPRTPNGRILMEAGNALFALPFRVR
jgi:hypothetical protein